MNTCVAFENVKSINDYLVWPTTCNPNFYLIILLALIAVIGWGIYKLEKKERSQGDLLSAFAVSSLAITVLAIFGTLIKNSSSIPMIQSNVLLYLVAITIVLDTLWIFKSRN